MSAPEDPPYYILVSHDSPPSIPSAAPSTSLSHPTIEYHYADDSPHSLLPRYPGEQIIVLDYDPTKGPTPTIKSLSKDLAVTGLRIADAPGAGVTAEDPRNNKMYILEAMTLPEETRDEEDHQSPHTILARFRQRNAILRSALEYPGSLQNGQQPTETTLQDPTSAAS
ncbi:hypothetical protein WOLCODRAFT_93757 [Wolfiporia cocos MD-104 SS10]|uniref:Uncharacterized protein n=1 Tax=Wolfiporia cocos (strain MD-104) TaxID=742152 RepID=A0A2H3J1A8_WOLCO|nr:hypothetical protein WOLCODRAFT_93757 [Wolfiporia cocos MD-104 SS10]